MLKRTSQQYASMAKRLKDRRRQRMMPPSATAVKSRRHGRFFRTMVVAISAFVLMIIGIPSIVIWMADREQEFVDLEIGADTLYVQVHRAEKNEIVELPLEEYIKGVVAAEMPAEFQLEALKAQALAARTYFFQKWNQNPGPISDDHRIDQAYLSDDQLRVRWGGRYAEYMSKINQAVNETSSMILTYEGKPIEAYFFSTSNGYTENSEDVWGKEIPYLRSVESSWDVISPKYQEVKRIPLSEVHERLKLVLPVAAWTGGQEAPRMVATRRSEGKRIMNLMIGDQAFSGREIREKLGLNSTHFTVNIEQDQMVFTTYGYGHGVGMSQWGAEALAREGKKAEEIVSYFYQGIMIQPYFQSVTRVK